MRRFEYCCYYEYGSRSNSLVPKQKFIGFSNGQNKDVSTVERLDILGSLGEEGWEMVVSTIIKPGTIDDSTFTLELYFKRELTK